MKTLITTLLLLVGSVCMAQNASDFFNSAGNQFIDGDTKTALSTVNRGLDRYPGNDKLKKLRDELMKQQEQEQQQQQQQQQQEQQEQEQKNQEQQNQEQQEQNQDQEKKDQEQQEQEQKNEEQQKDEEQKEEQKPEDAEKTEEEKEQEQKDELEKFLEKLKEMKISKEKAEMILQAMKNNEIQYVQQNKRKAKKRKDRSKPDW